MSFISIEDKKNTFICCFYVKETKKGGKLDNMSSVRDFRLFGKDSQNIINSDWREKHFYMNINFII